MNTFRFFIAGLVLAVFITPVLAADNPPSQAACRARLVDEMSAVHDEYRAHVFGSRADRSGDFTVLTGGKATAAYTGILETKGRLTSELVNPLVESYRVYRCRLIDVCAAAKHSYGSADRFIDTETLGCATETLPRYNECGFTPTADADTDAIPFDIIAMTNECQNLVVTSLATEREILKLAVGYDSGYRSLLQLAGMVDWMQKNMPSQTMKPIQSMINLLGKLHQIPCFIGQCDAPNTSGMFP